MTDDKNYPLALDCPKEKVVLITQEIINQAIDASRKSPRKRIIFPFHKSPSDKLHRMLNVLQPQSYIKPHRHFDPPKSESLIVLNGRLTCVEFNNTGEINAFYKLSSESFNIGIDIESGVYHTIFATVEDTVLFEVKPGPYERTSDKDFASWAPSEGDENAEEYLKNLYEVTKKVTGAVPHY